jgi:hypothetical protein
MIPRGSIAIGLAVLLLAAVRVDARDWPMPRVPADGGLSLVGESMQVNGMPMRIYQFTTRRDLEGVIDAFAAGIQGNVQRKRLQGDGGPLTIAGRSGDYWLTLQLVATPNGTRGTWSATPQFEQGAQQRISRPPGFPPSAHLLQQVDSLDAGKRSQLVVGLDRASIDVVARQLEVDLRTAGYSKQPFIERHWIDSNQYVAMYGRPREEIMVTLRRDPNGTAITMNRVTALEVLQ